MLYESHDLTICNMNNGNVTDVLTRILRTAENGETKTKVIYGAYISSMQTEEYLRFLAQRGMLAYESENKLYRITWKGEQFLRDYDLINGMVDWEQVEKRQEASPTVQ